MAKRGDRQTLARGDHADYRMLDPGDAQPPVAGQAR